MFFFFFFSLAQKGGICRFNLPFSKDVLLLLMLLPSSGRFSFDVDSDPRRDINLVFCITRRA
jgi:hypothetical protein